uniref:Uncharacterized protein n=1 Tax=Heterorhabditis bacteriophora TaxID=37862 RepID=A0A1I7WL84_HETBA
MSNNLISGHKRSQIVPLVYLDKDYKSTKFLLIVLYV